MKEIEMTDTQTPDAPEVEATETPAPEEVAPEPTPDAVPPAPAPVAPAPRTGNAAWAAEDERDMVKQFMAKLRAAGYVRPELSRFTGYNDSTVWRAQQGRVHTREIEHWMKTVFEPFTNGTLPPPAASLRTPKPEVLLAKLDAVQDKIAQAVEALSNPEVKTVKDFRALVAEVAASLSA